MKTDLIRKEDAINVIRETVAEGLLEDTLELRLKDLPSAEKTGKWLITDAYPHNVHCSECYAKFAQTHWEVWEDGSLPRKYCPNCGAKMEGGQDETD